jgi:putative peptidoglycan lipid II flippase
MSVARSSLLFASGTLLSRIAGLIRDRIVLSYFGASDLMGGFIVAFRIPNMLREMLAEGALGSSFTKVYSGLCATDDKRAQALLVDAMVLMTTVAVIVTGLGVVCAPWIVRIMTDNDASQLLLSTATGLTRLLFPFLGFMIIGAIAMGALHQFGRFFLTSVSPLAFNVFYILGAVWFAGAFERLQPAWMTEWFAAPGITGLAMGVLLGGLAQTLIQFVGIWPKLRIGLQGYRPRLPWSPDVKKVLTLMLPMVLAASAGQINVMVNTIFATGLQEGAVTWLYSSFRLLHFPIGMFSVAIGAAVLPALARTMAKAGGNIDRAASHEIQNAVELVLWFMVPCFVFMVLNAEAIVRCLYEGGRFTLRDSQETAAALSAYSWSLITYGLIKVLTSFYFAIERTGYALKVSLFGIIVNAVSNYLLVTKYGHVGIAFGYSVTLIASVGLLLLGLRGVGITVDWRRFGKSMGLLVLAGAAAALLQAAGPAVLHQLGGLPHAPVWLSSGLYLLVNGVLLVGVFLIVGMKLTGLTPTEGWRRLRRKKSS